MALLKLVRFAELVEQLVPQVLRARLGQELPVVLDLGALLQRNELQWP
jgi:hypothetical protein